MIGILLLPIVLLVVAQLGLMLFRPGKPKVGRSEANLRVVRALKRGSAAVLAGGIVASVILYATAAPDAANDPDLQADTLAMSHTTSKKAEAEMERIGGKANVEMANFEDWFVAQWQGRRLGLTILILAVFIALILFLVARGLH